MKVISTFGHNYDELSRPYGTVYNCADEDFGHLYACGLVLKAEDKAEEKPQPKDEKPKGKVKPEKVKFEDKAEEAKVNDDSTEI
jgi:hypothetical protein